MTSTRISLFAPFGAMLLTAAMLVNVPFVRARWKIRYSLRSEQCSSLPRCSSTFHSCKHDGKFAIRSVRSNAPHCRDARQRSIRASTMERFLAIRAKENCAYAKRRGHSQSHNILYLFCKITRYTVQGLP